MRILVTFAVEAEFAPWRARHPFVPYEFDDAGQRREFDLYRANIGSNSPPGVPVILSYPMSSTMRGSGENSICIEQISVRMK